MLTVLIECRDNEAELAQTLTALVAGAVDGLVSDVILIDHGSSDGTAQLADAAGCRLASGEAIDSVLATARGQWLLLVEPGARPQSGWVEEIADYLAAGGKPATFTASRLYRRPLARRLFSRPRPVETGHLVRKDEAMKLVAAGLTLDRLAHKRPRHRLRSEIIPAWALG